jgi:hypothetical protein
MDVTTVAQAVTTLQQQGKPVTIRNVHQLTQGSFRDISRILRALPVQPSVLPSSPGSAADGTPPPRYERSNIAQISPPLRSDVQRQALAEYQNVLHEWQVRQQPRQGWLPADRTSILVQVARRLEHARQRLKALGINPEALQGR